MKWVVIRSTTLFNLKPNNIALQVAAICCLCYFTLTEVTTFRIRCNIAKIRIYRHTENISLDSESTDSESRCRPLAKIVIIIKYIAVPWTNYETGSGLTSFSLTLTAKKFKRVASLSDNNPTTNILLAKTIIPNVLIFRYSCIKP